MERLLEGKDLFTYWKQVFKQRYYEIRYYYHKKNRLSHINHFHNTFLHILSRDGIFGLTVFVYWMLNQMKYFVFSKKYQSDIGKIYAIVFAMVTVGFMFSGLTNAHLESSKVLMVLILYLGIICSYLKCFLKPEKSKIF